MLSDLTADMQHTSKDDKWKGLNQARPGKATVKKKKKTLRKPLNYSNSSIKLIPAVSAFADRGHEKKKKKR